MDAGVGVRRGRLSWSRFETVLEARVIEADPEAAAARRRWLRPSSSRRSTRSRRARPEELYVKSTVAVITRIDATVDYLCQALRALGDTESADGLRVKAMLLLANHSRPSRR